MRLSDAELEQYNKYNEIIEDLSYQLEQLEAEGKDVFDLKLELKLSLDKVKSGSFNMVEIYLEGLKPRIEKIWKDLGKSPKKKQIELISETELKSSIEAAKKESEKIKVETPGQGEVQERKVLGINDDVPPDKMLKLVNGTLVIKLKALIDEVKVLKDDEFEKHVNENKNDFSAWIRDALNNEKLADLADQIISKEDFIAFLEAVDSGKEKTFKPATPRTQPFSSKTSVKPVEAKPAEEKKAEESKPEEKKEEAAMEKKPAEEKETENKPPAENLQATKPSNPQTEIIKNYQAESAKNLQEVKISIASQTEEKKNEAAALVQISSAAVPAANIEPNTQAVPVKVEWALLKPKLATISSKEKIELLKKALEDSPENPKIMFTLAAEYHRTLDLENAEVYYKKILEKTPDNPKVLYYLGSAYNAQKKYSDALDVYNKILAIQPDYPKVKEYADSIQKILLQPAAQA